MAEFFYHLFGLRLRSGLELPELAEATASDFDVDIKVVGQVPEGGASIDVPGIALFEVKAGGIIHVAPVPGASAANVRLFLLGSAMGLLLHQRGDLPLHANSLLVEGRAIAVMGASGAGKSSLAAWMCRHGVAALSDDVCVVRSSGASKAVLYPGVPRLRLWEDALIREGRIPELLVPVYDGDPDYRKYVVPVELPVPDHDGRPLSAAYVLEAGSWFGIERIEGFDAVSAFFAHTYRGEFVQSDGSPVRHWEACTWLASAIPTYRIVRTMALSDLEDENRQIRSHMLKAVNETGMA